MSSTENSSKSLSQKLWEENDDDKDFTFIVGGCEEIKAHKHVLAACSPVFKTLIKTESSMEIVKFDSNIVKKAIKFCYDFSEFGNENANDLIALLQFAHQYEFQDLKDNSEIELIKKLCVENFCELANLSMECKVEKLREKCFDFLTDCFDDEEKEDAIIPNIEILDKDFAKLHLIEAFGKVENEDDDVKVADDEVHEEKRDDNAFLPLFDLLKHEQIPFFIIALLFIFNCILLCMLGIYRENQKNPIQAAKLACDCFGPNGLYK